MALVETLSDNFNAPTMNTSLWTLQQSQGTTSQATGQLVITPKPSFVGSSYDGYNSLGTFDCRNSSLTIQLVQGVGTTSGVEQIMQIWKDLNNQISFMITNTSYTFRIETGGSNSDTFFAGRNDSLFAWWRIRTINGSIYWDSSADGKTWTTRRVATGPSFDISSANVEIVAGTWQSVASPGTAIFDNFNILNTGSVAWIV